METPIRVLIVEDATDDAELMLLHLRREGFAPSFRQVEDASGLQAALAADPWDILLADYTLPGFGARAALAIVRRTNPDLPVVIVSGSVGEEAAVEMMRAGASDYVLKSNLTRLGPVVAREIREAENRRARRSAELEAEKLAAIARSTDDAVIGKDLTGTIRSWNPAAERVYGWTAAEAIGRPIALVVPPDRYDELATIMARIRAGELVDHFETVRQRRDGTRVDVSLTISPIYDHAGRLVGASKIARDITARKRADAERQELALQYSNLFDMAVIGIFQSTPGGRYRTVNPAFARIFGYATVDELLHAVTDIGCQLYADPEQRAEYVRRLSERPTMLGFECEARRKDGTPIWIRLDARSVRDEAGELLYFEGFAQDISATKRAERHLQESERFLRSSLDALSAHIAILDANGTILTVNEVWRRFARDNHLSGATGAVGSNYLDVCDAATGDCAEEARAAAAGIRAVLSGSAPLFSLAYPCHSPTEQRWFMLRATRFDGADGIRVVVAHENITEVKRGEEALRRTTELLNAVADGTPDAVFVKDEIGRYLLCNAATAGYVGRAVDDVLGRDDAALFDPDSARRIMEVDQRVMATGASETTEETLTAVGTTRTYFTTKGPYRDGGGRIVGVLGISRDISDRKRAEAALRESEERFRLAVEATGAGAWDHRLGSPEIEFSDQLKAIFGLPPEAVVTRERLFELIHPDDRGAFAAVVEAATDTTGDGAYVSEHRIVRPDGAVAWVVSHGRSIFDGPPGARRVVRSVGIVRDVTDRKRAEAERDELLNRLQLQIDRMPIACIMYDAEIRHSGWNPAAERIFGYTSAEIVGRPAEALVHADDRPLIASISARLRAGDVAAHSINRNVTKDGRVITCEWHNTPLFGADKTFLGILSMTLDVTDRVRAEAALRESEGRFRAFMDNGPFLAWITEVEGRLDYASGPFTRALSVPAGGVEGRHLTDVFPPEVARTYQKNNREVARTGRALATTEPGVLADGSPGVFLVYKFPIPSPDRSLVGGVAIDITERARLQAQLSMRDRAIQAVHQGIVITDPTLPDNPIVYASPGFEQTTGYPVTEVVGRNCRFLQGKETDRAEVTRLRNALAAGDGYSGELLNYRKDGTTFWNEVSITPVYDASGRLVNFVGIQTNVTARRSLEDQLRQAQKMEAVGQLAGGVAHDFNNLLTVINGYSEMVLGDTAPGHPLRDPLVAIRDAGERAANLTQQLLAFSRRAIVAPRVLDLNDVVASITKLLRRLIGEDIALATVLCPTPCRVRIDPGQIEQVIMNLAVNARDAMPTRGRLTIDTGTERVPSTDPNGPAERYVRLGVTDTGVGMTEEVKARVFEPFFTTKDVGKGTGLGLAMVYGIITQAGGQIRVASQPGRGTAFELLLPEIQTSGTVTTADTIRLAPRGSETVLLAEDEDEVRRFARLALEMQGYTVLEARSGGEARALAESHSGSIHLLVTDVVMPDLGGRELADAVRARRQNVAVLYISGYTDDSIVRHGVETAAHSFLQKPFTPLTLARKVREVLDAPQTVGRNYTRPRN